MIYQPGQVKPLLKYVTEDTGLFLLGGPADANEAQVFHDHFPFIPIIGVEPNRRMLRYQEQVGFPGVMIPKALFDRETVMPFYLLGEDDRSSRLSAEQAPAYFVQTTTIDSVVRLMGQSFTGKIALWLDIERSELSALMGATYCFTHDLIQTVYLEVLPDTEESLNGLLKCYGFTQAERVNEHGSTKDVHIPMDYRYDAIYTRG